MWQRTKDFDEENQSIPVQISILDVSPKDITRCALVAHSPTGVLKYEI